MNLKLMLCIASAAICIFSGAATASTSPTRGIGDPIEAAIAAPLATKQARKGEPLRVAPTGCRGSLCNQRGIEPLRMAPGCPSCTRNGVEPLKMAPNCTTCGRSRVEPLRVAPTGCSNGCTKGA